MDATAWTVVGTAITILAAIGGAFGNLRTDLRKRINDQGKDLRAHIDAQGKDLRERIDAQGEQTGQLRERLAYFDGRLTERDQASTVSRYELFELFERRGHISVPK